MKRPLSVLFDLGIVLVASMALWGLLSEEPVLKKTFGVPPRPVRVFLSPLTHWGVELSGLFAVLVGVRLYQSRPASRVRVKSKEQGPDAIRRSAIDLSRIEREAPEAVDQIGDLIARRGRDSTVEVMDLVDDIIIAAEFIGASDVHVEPKENAIRISFRVDGVMREISSLPKDVEARLTNRFRVISHLDFAKVDTPQDGRVEEKIRGRPMNLRVSVFPTLFGSKIVLRLLDSGAHALPELGRLGLRDDVLSEFRRLIHGPQGMMLFTGPTGSGKTTLMYSALLEIVEREQIQRNVVTLEDPIERVLAPVNQTQVDSKRGISFAAGLRTILRQDPDVIMVGEIRDIETAEIALRAGQTGHLLMTTLHTNSTAGAFTRLMDMGLEPFLLASAVSGVVGTRLVRRLCPTCKLRKNPSDVLLAQLPVRLTNDYEFYESRGCMECRNTGFVGRMLVFELLSVTEELAAAVLNKKPQTELAKIAIGQGMRTMLQDGLDKVRTGQTSLVELLRVVQ